MEETKPTAEMDHKKYDEEIQKFFAAMDYTQEQKAMFFLGRMLNSVEYVQEGKNRTVIQKVNFNGMDKDDIQRLRTGLIEKAKQYNAMGKVIFTDNKFGEQFDYNHWNLNPKESLFFLLTGYSFGAKAKNSNDSETTENN